MACKRLLLLIFLLVPSAVWGQNAVVAIPTTLLAGPRLGSNLTISFCTSTATGIPCTPFAQAYADSTNSNPINQTINPLRTDSLGNAVVFYAAPGQYSYTITGPGLAAPQGPYQITVPCIPGSTCVSASANNAFTGNNSFTGQNSIAAYNVNNIVTVDGVKYTTLNAAFADPVCAAGTGCTIDMRGNSSSAALALGSFDPGPTPVNLLLGPYNYTTTGITLRTNFHIEGVAQGGPTSTSTGTNINALNTSVPAIITMPATAPLGITDVLISHVRVLCATGNSSQIGMNITAPANSGLWYSTMNNILVQGCQGEGMLFASAGYPAINQFLEFRSVTVIRNSGGAPALHIVGINGQFGFINCEFDAAAQFGGTHDSLPNVLIEDIVTPFLAAYNIDMYQTTIQGGGIGIELRGTQNFVCDNCHFEHDWGVLNAAQGHNYGNYGVGITNSAIYTSGVNSGAGYLITMDANAEINFDNNGNFGTPDNFYLGTLTQLTARGLFNISNGLPFPSGQSSMRIANGVFSDSSGFKFVTQSVSSVPSGRSSVTVTWTTPFPDNGYTPVCFVGDFVTAATSQGVTVERESGTLQSASSFGVTINNPTGGTVSSINLNCIAVRAGS